MEYIKYLKECGFNDIEIQTKLKEREIMKQLYFKEKKSQDILQLQLMKE